LCEKKIKENQQRYEFGGRKIARIIVGEREM
jgi:hypothetical protein